MTSRKPKISINKITFLTVACGFISIVLVLRLFQLQIIDHQKYQDMATREQLGTIQLPAERGEIIIKDYNSNEEFSLATNITQNLLYADPALTKDPVFVGKTLTPIIFNLKDTRQQDDIRIDKLARNLSAEITDEEKEKLLKKPTDQELQDQYQKEMIEKISEKQRKQILLVENMEAKKLEKLKQNLVSGIEIVKTNVYAYPIQISNPTSTAERIADYVEIPSKKLATILKGVNRYVVLEKKLSIEQSEAIKALKQKDEHALFTGIGMQENFYRYYPENKVGANLVGYVDKSNIGQYGIESTFNSQLQGKPGEFKAKRDSIGRQITVGESVLRPAKDGDDIVLTIDRSIQLKVENILSEAVQEYRADSGQVLIMDPKTGRVIAMAHYPSFDPNNFGKVFEKIEISLTPEEIASLYPTKNKGVYYFYKNPITLDRYMVFEEKDENGNNHYLRYKNFVGPEAYHNKIVSWPYEPGSVFKSVVMSIAIDDRDVTPNTTFNDSGPIGVDFNKYKNEYDFFIKNSEGNYFGLINMTTVIAKSLNTGMTFVAKKMGAPLFYSYLEKFGFLDRTDIEFDTEVTGKIRYFNEWTESELATAAFGQGITVTMMQLANAYSVIANGGILYQPHIIEEIRHDDGTKETFEPIEIRRVLSEETSAKMTAMLTYSTQEGVANRAQVPGHLVAGKTGTSQTYKHGQALSGKGTTIASFAGYGPVNDPKFVVLIKFDRPQTSEWGSATAAPTFSKIAEYLFSYYNIPPDKKITQ